MKSGSSLWGILIHFSCAPPLPPPAKPLECLSVIMIFSPPLLLFNQQPEPASFPIMEIPDPFKAFSCSMTRMFSFEMAIGRQLPPVARKPLPVFFGLPGIASVHHVIEGARVSYSEGSRHGRVGL